MVSLDDLSLKFKLTYITGVLFHLMRELMRVADSPSPKAVLTQLIFSTFLAFVAKAIKIRALARTTFNWMSNILYNRKPMKYIEPNETRWTNVG